MNNLERFNLILSTIFKVDIALINDDMSPENTEKWDSFNTLSMIITLEKEFDVILPLEEFITIKMVKDIKYLLINKGVDLK